ncbi:MAG: hypothetical protein RL141_475 [Candidatus Parcubacteria bacterium]|jgi:hypothetical protein
MTLLRHPMIRALGIITLKTLTMAVISLADVLFIAAYVPVKVHTLVMLPVVFAITFLFGEWIFNHARFEARTVALIIVTTYLWDAFLGALIFASLIGDMSVLAQQQLTPHLLAFALHAAALGAALYDRRRFGRDKNVVEGLQ